MTTIRLIDRVVNWAKKEDNVRALILQGSQATSNHDKFSDYDLDLFCTTFDPYITSDIWLSEIGNVWVCVAEKAQRIPRRCI